MANEQQIQAKIEWREDDPFIHRLFVNETYVGKLHFTVKGDTVESCQFVRASDHMRIPVSMTRLMLQAAKYEILSMILKPRQQDDGGKNSG